MKRKISIVMALLFCFMLLAACGGNTPASPAPSSSAPSSAAPSSQPPPSTPEPPGTFTVGALLNLTGWFSTQDTANSEALQAMVDILNEEGGIVVGGKTYMIEVDLQDGMSDATGTRNGAQILINNGRKYSIVANCFFIEGSLDLFHNAKVMTLMNMNSMNFEVLNPKWPYSFWVNNGAIHWIGSAMDAMKQHFPNVKSIVFCNNDDGNQGPMAERIKAEAEKRGLTYIDSPVFYDPNITDFSGVALQVIRTGADSFMGNFNPAMGSAMLKEIRNAGSDMVFAILSGNNAKTFIDAAGADVAWNMLTLGIDQTEANTPASFWKLWNRVKDKYGEQAAVNISLSGANSIYVLKQLIEGAQSFDVDDVIKYWDTKPALDTVRGPGTIGGLKTFGIDRVLSSPNAISLAEKGGVVKFGGWFPSSLD